MSEQLAKPPSARLTDRPPAAPASPNRSTGRIALPREAVGSGSHRPSAGLPAPSVFTRRPADRFAVPRATPSVGNRDRELVAQAAAEQRRKLRADIESCIREQIAGGAGVAEMVCRLCEMLEADHACLWSAPGNGAGGDRFWGRQAIVAEAISDSYPLENFTSLPPPAQWSSYYLEPAIRAARACTRFQGFPPDAPDSLKTDPRAQSQYLALSLQGRPGHQWLLLFERQGARDATGAHAWTEDDALMFGEMSLLLGLCLENHLLSAQSDERASYLSNMLNSMDLAVMVIEQPLAPGALATVSLVNRGFCEIFGVQPAEVEGASYLALIDRVRALLPDPEEQLALLERLLADPTAEHIDEIVLDAPEVEGGRRTLHRYATPARDAAGRIFGRMFFFRDITYDKELERQLLHSQKMDSIGTLAGGVAHDFNNLLTTILGYAELLKRELKDDEPRRAKLLQIEKSANRAAELTGQLLAFSRRHPTLLKVFDLNKLVTETMSMLRSTVSASIELATDPYPKLPNIEADETQIQQVLINLVLNARDALPGSGTITVSTRPGFDTQAQPGISSTIYTILEVEDDGVGIPKDVLHRIFEPFYTTKEVGKGTGLGLAMVYGIVKKHNGFIEVTSALGVGTKFSVFLPSTAKSAEGGGVLSSGPRRHGKRELVILVVDDEPALREFCVAALGEMCTEILTASNGMEAIEQFKRVGGRVDLVLLDLTMPKMSGPECFQHLRALDPECRILISSGYNLDLNDRSVIGQQAAGFLPKPYDLNQLLESVERALDFGSAQDAVG